ncbi:hypothetical protein NDU88_001257 [Pleurodeles waltl]|uniref:Uncharacterized protein n=1 Tax=Pleurodeles waltl TaxID=8319 RepID=A0AAV7PAM7_PLEWA|nr:hypothetical protein NDU88_001257 [Pleurodeles waltl]
MGSAGCRERRTPRGEDQIGTKLGLKLRIRSKKTVKLKLTPISERDTQLPPELQTKRTKGRAGGGPKAWADTPGERLAGNSGITHWCRIARKSWSNENTPKRGPREKKTLPNRLARRTRNRSHSYS